MAFCSVQWFGESIGKATGMYVLLPEGRGPFPVLYLLHGLSDDHTIWQRRTSIERYAANLPLIIAMPDGHRSFYCNDPRPGGCAYEDHIVRDVVGFVDRTFPTLARCTARAVAGLSMGGYGAVMLALRHPDVFGTACAHSAAFDFAHRRGEGRADINALADVLPPGSYDCFALAEAHARGGAPLALRFDCGTEDPLLEGNRRFHEHLDRLRVPHVYAERRGGHTWDYWDAHVRQTLSFVLRHVRAD